MDKAEHPALTTASEGNSGARQWNVTHQWDHQTVKHHDKHHHVVYAGFAGPFSPLDVVRSEKEGNKYPCVRLHVSARTLRNT